MKRWWRVIAWLFNTMVLLALLGAGWLYQQIHQPHAMPDDYLFTVKKGQGMAAVGRQLAGDGVVSHRYLLSIPAKLKGIDNRLAQGTYRLTGMMSAADIVNKLAQAQVEQVAVRLAEGETVSKLRQRLTTVVHLRPVSATWDDKALLQALGADEASLEGLLYPDTYQVAYGSEDLAVYRAAYQHMQRVLQEVWDGRDAGLPYKNPYELLIMGSIIEKETGHAEDRAQVAAVFVNRLRINMRLQTDPTVIYGMGDAYQGRLRRADLERDTPYNTYTRQGLPPTPIAMVSRASLEAAAHPADVKYLYFVSRQDGSGRSEFSDHLNEHNRAVQRYILGKP